MGPLKNLPIFQTGPQKTLAITGTPGGVHIKRRQKLTVSAIADRLFRNSERGPHLRQVPYTTSVARHDIQRPAWFSYPLP